MSVDDSVWMQRALDEARRAALEDEVPVGAVVVQADRLLAVAHNRTLTANDPTAHAEIEAIRQAAINIGAARLPGTVLYVTLEPCLMCLGAAVHARIGRVVFGASDPKVGAAQLWNSVPVGLRGLNHRVELEGGVLAAESADLLREFFRRRR
ncbi:MAG: tRNA adenosine(34) deaminase TadA [Acidobacteriota bacterium]